MSVLLHSVILAFAAFVTGTLGAPTGLGGGAILALMLVLFFHVHMRYAAGASLIAVIATSAGAAGQYLTEGYTNLRIGMSLQLTSILGGIAGAMLVAIIPVRILLILFGAALLYSSYFSFRRKEEADADRPSDPLAVRLHMESSYPVAYDWRAYKVVRVIPGALLMGVAEIVSGLLGIGAGTVNVRVMDHTMKFPDKVSVSTSNFMIGITAASTGIYLDQGFIDPVLTMPVMPGVLGGAVLGARY